MLRGHAAGLDLVWDFIHYSGKEAAIKVPMSVLFICICGCVDRWNFNDFFSTSQVLVRNFSLLQFYIKSILGEGQIWAVHCSQQILKVLVEFLKHSCRWHTEDSLPLTRHSCSHLWPAGQCPGSHHCPVSALYWSSPALPVIPIPIVVSTPAPQPYTHLGRQGLPGQSKSHFHREHDSDQNMIILTIWIS